MNRQLKVALFGAGRRGRAVLRNWIQLTGCKITAVVDPSEESLRRTSETLYDIIGEKGAISCRYAMDDRMYVQYRKRGSATIEHFSIYNRDGGGHGGGDYRIIQLMNEALRQGQQMRPDILDGRNAVAVCEAIDRSIETRLPVEIPRYPHG